MTRAKRELILSFHGAASPWIRAVSDTIATEFWSEFDVLDKTLMSGCPDKLPQFEPEMDITDALLLNGKQYLFTSQALGLSLEAQDKVSELVDGIGARAAGTNGRRLRWPSMKTLAIDLKDGRRYDNVFGPKVAEELRQHFASYV